MKLYYNPASTTCRMIMMLAAEEGIPLDFVAIDLAAGEHRQPAYKAINPSGLVPTLEDEGFRLAESGAILRYLAGKAGSAAYPDDLQKRARVDEAMEWLYSNLYKDLGYGMIYPQLFPHHKRPNDDVQAATVEWGKNKSQHWLGILDKELLGPDRAFLCGDEISLADYVGAEMLTLGELVHSRYEDYPNVRRWLGNMKALKSWAQVHEAADRFAASLKDRQFVSI